MRFNRILAILICLLFAFSAASFVKSTKSTKATKHHSSAKPAKYSKSKSGKKSKKAWQAKGQKAISNDRTREIQTALIREHYLSGEATGNMDNATKDALVKLQQQNGWQTKVVPDSRALIKLGLGPSQSDLLNPDTAALANAVASRRSER